MVVCPIVWSSRMFAHCRVRGIGDQKIYWMGFMGPGSNYATTPGIGPHVCRAGGARGDQRSPAPPHTQPKDPPQRRGRTGMWYGTPSGGVWRPSMPRPADVVGVPPHMIGRPCATQHRSGECGAYHAGGPVQETAPAGRRGISAVPVRDMAGGGPKIWNAAEIPHVPDDTTPRRIGGRARDQDRCAGGAMPVRRIRTPATHNTHTTNGRRPTGPVASWIAPRAIPYGTGTLRMSRGTPRHALAMPRPPPYVPAAAPDITPV